MANKRLTDRNELTTAPASDDLIHIVDVSDTTDNAAGTSKKVTVDILTSGIITSPISTNPVENEYADITALLADQSNQTEDFFQYVVDASADPNITSGDAYYQKLSTSTATLADDYNLLSDSEVLVLEANNGWRVFKVQSINDDSTPLTSVGSGKIGLDYNTGTGKVTSILFNATFTDVIEEITSLSNLSIQIYNQTKRKLYSTSVTSFTTVGVYTRANVGSEITASDFSVNNKLEVYFDETGSGGGSADTDTGTEFDLSNPIGTFYNMSSADSSTTYTFDNATKVLGGVAFKLVNASSEPTVTSATKIAKGNNFEADTDIYLVVKYNGNRVEYFWESITADLSQYTGLPYGTVITEKITTNNYVGSPCILKTSTGRYIISHDVFGGGTDDKTTSIYTSDVISSNNWKKVTELSDFIWGTLFEYNSDIYILGCTDYPSSGSIVISKSTNNGNTWSTPVTVLSIPATYNGWQTSPQNIIIKDGYLVKPFTLSSIVGTFADTYETTLVFADLTDLTDNANWSYSNIVAFDGTTFANSLIYSNTPYAKEPDGTSTVYKGFLEPCLVEKSNGDLIVVSRLEQNPNSNHAVYFDVTWNSGTPTSSTISSTHNFIDMYGGNVKFQILYDSTSAKHWSIVNLNKYRYYGDNRIEAYLISSDDDCVTWTAHEKVLGFTPTSDWENEIESLGVQYAHFIIDNDDLLIADRTSNADANSWHNANLFTLTAVKDFRNSTSLGLLDGSLIIDENSDRIEDANGIAVIHDRSKYLNSPFMLDVDNANKVAWNSGLDFATATGYLRAFYERSLMLDYSTGLTMYAVIENIQDTGGKRILSFGDTGADDTQAGNWFFSANVGLGIETARGVYTDLTLNNDYIIAASFDAINNHIYNFLNGVNRGNPPTKNDATWSTDHLVMTTGYTGSYFSELRIGDRIVGSTQPFSSLIKAIHIVPSYTTPANVITYMNTLNTTYSIY